jgi:DNA-binding NtrC family response regulator
MEYLKINYSSQHKLIVSPFIQQIYETIERIALSGMSVLIVGEEGTERETIARIVHLLSGRRKEKFFKVDCRQLSPLNAECEIFGSENLYLNRIEIYQGSLEKTFGGTIFLDNFSCLSGNLIKKISKTVKNHHFHRVEGVNELEINVRLVTAIDKTKNDINTETYGDVDFYNKICPLSINIPPLRERREDIIFLIDLFIQNNNATSFKSIKRLSGEALGFFLRYDWPGNTRQLQNTVDYSVNACNSDMIEVTHLPSYLLKKESILCKTFKENNIHSSTSSTKN